MNGCQTGYIIHVLREDYPIRITREKKREKGEGIRGPMRLEAWDLAGNVMKEESGE